MRLEADASRRTSNSCEIQIFQQLARRRNSSLTFAEHFIHDLDEFEDQRESEIEKELPPESIEYAFNPELIKVRTNPILVDQIVSRSALGEIDLTPDVQRERGIWDNQAKSRFIESILLKLPLLVFYVAADNHENWSVVDGAQRFSTICDYVNDQFVLKNLEYLVDLEGKTHAEIPRRFQRRLIENSLQVNVIEPGTPLEVKFNFFKRINTGGLPLRAQEIRHALHPGPVRDRLKNMANSDTFLTVTNRSISSKRMADRECVLRFIAFYSEDWESYNAKRLDSFLVEAMQRVNAIDDSSFDNLGVCRSDTPQ